MSALDDLGDLLVKSIGGNEEAQEPSAWITTGYPELNRCITGDPERGFPQGRMAEIYGPSSAGKTVIATNMMIAAQKQGGIAFFSDHERSFNVHMAQYMGLDTSKGKWIYKMPATWEEAHVVLSKLGRVVRESKLIPHDAPIVGVVDSVASCVPQSVLYIDGDPKKGMRDLDSRTMNDNTALSRVTAQTLSVIKTQCREYNVTLFYLNQIRTKPGVSYGNPTYTPGGGAVEFYCDTRLELTRQVLKAKADNEFLGQKIGILVKKNKFAKPFEKTELRLMYDDDGRAYFDYAYSMIERLQEEKLMPNGNTHIEWDGKKFVTKSLAAYINKHGQLNRLAELLYKRAPTPTAVAA